MCHCQWWLKACSSRVEKWRQTIAVFDPRWGQALYKLLISTCAMYCKKNQVTIFMDRLQIFVTVETKFSSLQLLTNDTFFSIKKNDTIFF